MKYKKQSINQHTFSGFVAGNIGTYYKSPFGTAGSSTVGTLVTTLLNVFYVVLGITLLFLFIMGGYNMMQAAGGGNREAAEKGKAMITYAVVGLVVALSSFWFVRLIELVTGSTFITAPSLPGMK